MTTDLDALLRESHIIHIRWKQMANVLLEREQLTVAQAYLLEYILRHEAGGACITAICRESGLALPTMSRLVKRMRERTYVRMADCPGDARRKLLVPTEKAWKVRPFLTRCFQRTQALLFRDFSPQELEQLDHLQKKMLRNLSADDTKTHLKEESST